MGGFYFFIIIMAYVFFFRNNQKKNGDNNNRSSSSNNTPYRPPQSSSQPQRRPQNAPRIVPQTYRQAPARSSQHYDISGFDSQHFHKDGYDFATCFSFKDVPPGCDELTALMEANSRHERKLEKMLQVRD